MSTTDGETIHALAEGVRNGSLTPPAPFAPGDDILTELATGSIKPSDIVPTTDDSAAEVADRVRNLLIDTLRRLNEESVLLNRISDEAYRLFPDDNADAGRLFWLLRRRHFPDSSVGLFIRAGNLDEGLLQEDENADVYGECLVTAMNAECPIAAPVEPAGDSVRDGGAGVPLMFTYRNWRGEEGARRATPLSVRYGTTEWHPEPTWLLRAFDHDKEAEREFAMRYIGAARVSAAQQPDPDRETAITTLLTQVGSSHEAYPGAKRDLVRAFLARHGAEARGEVGTGDDAAFVDRMAKRWGTHKGSNRQDGANMWRLIGLAYLGTKKDIGFVANIDFDPVEAAQVDAEMVDILARRGARAPVAGGEPVAPVAWQWRCAGNSWSTVLREVVARSRAAELGNDGEVRPLYTHPPAPPVPTAEPLQPGEELWVMGRDASGRGFGIRQVRPNPPHGHRAPPAPVGGVSEACDEIAIGIRSLRRTWERVNAREPVKALSEALCVVDIVRDRRAPTPDDGCPKGDPDCLGGNGDCHDACSTFAERGALEERSQVQIALRWAMDEIDILSNRLCNFGYPQGLLMLGRKEQRTHYERAIRARSRASTPAGHDKTEA